MTRYVLRRLAIIPPILIGLSIVVFIAARRIASPEKALTFNPRIRAEDKERYAEQLGLDRPAWEQYFEWLKNTLRGDFGDSLISNRAVWPQIESALANTLVLAATAVFFSLIIGVGLGLLGAIRQNSWTDYFVSFGSVLGFSIPTFLVGLLAQVAVVRWIPDLFNTDPILPTSGMFEPGSTTFQFWDRVEHLVLPAFVLSVQLVAVYAKYVRASMVEVLGSDYIRTARMKGLTESQVVVRHGLRTSLIPLTTQASIDIAALVGGLVVTETIFAWPGMGSLFLSALGDGDYIIILPWLLITATAVMLMSLVADTLYSVLDPRIRYD